MVQVIVVPAGVTAAAEEYRTLIQGLRMDWLAPLYPRRTSDCWRRAGPHSR